MGEAFDKTAKMLDLGYPGGPNIFAGEIVSLHAKVSRAFNSSMEVFIDVFVENSDGSRRKCNEAIYNFVAIDQNRNPISVPSLIPETQIDKQRFDSALRRKQLSLVLAGKLKAENATELKNALFPNLKFCGDNAAMIAWAGVEKFKLKAVLCLVFAAKSRWPLDPSAKYLKGPGLKL